MSGHMSPSTMAEPASFGSSYGSMPTEAEPLVHLSLHPKGAKRARIDIMPILLNIFLPVAIFAITCAVLSFKVNYNAWALAWIIALCGALPGVYAGVQSSKAFKKDGKDSAQGRWLRLLCIFCIGAWLFGVVLGMMNYSSNMRPFYDMSGLNSYPEVDPSKSGQAYIDAGRIMFEPSAQLSIERSMGVKVSNTYCVAPIINANVPEDKREFDFWAVGMDCCDSVQPQDRWKCGEVDNHLAHGAMRLMTDAARPFYRMAVQEAEATYHITARHPIFVEWMQDPAGKMAAWREAGVRWYVKSLCCICVLMFFLSFSAGIYLSRASSESHPCQGTGFYKYVDSNRNHDFCAEEGHVNMTKRIVL